MTISSFAAALQGKNFQCVLAPSAKRDDALIKTLADRAASMATTACGMRSGRAIVGDKTHFWIYTWNTLCDTEVPLFFMTDNEQEYVHWCKRFAEGPQC